MTNHYIPIMQKHWQYPALTRPWFKWNPHTKRWNAKWSNPLWTIGWPFLIFKDTLIHSSTHNPQYLPNKSKNICPHKDLYALLIISKNWKQSKRLSTREWINLWYICTVEYLSTIKTNYWYMQQHEWISKELC